MSCFSTCFTWKETNHSLDPSFVATRSRSTGIIAAFSCSSFSIVSSSFSLIARSFSCTASSFSFTERCCSNQRSRVESDASAARTSERFAGGDASASAARGSVVEDFDENDLDPEGSSSVFASVPDFVPDSFVGSGVEEDILESSSPTNFLNKSALKSAPLVPRVSSRAFSSLNSSSASTCVCFLSASAAARSSASSSGSTCVLAMSIARSSSSVLTPNWSPKSRVNMSWDLSEEATFGCFSVAALAVAVISSTLFSWGVICPVGWGSAGLDASAESVLVVDFLAEDFLTPDFLEVGESSLEEEDSSSLPTSASHHFPPDLCVDETCATCFAPSGRNPLAFWTTAVPCNKPDPAKPAIARPATRDPATASRVKEPRVGSDPRCFPSGKCCRSDCVSSGPRVAATMVGSCLRPTATCTRGRRTCRCAASGTR
mmetsp:Transcript_14055/g.46594  ORF Transcript_14055/g.46594 Transcript_14055/m.46594 type:complete len:431 (-) Transcript_14055:17-1309(-)